jgi:4-alpha-glucanotransferase
VRAGGRLFSIGPRPELRALAPYDIARAEQLDLAVAPWADGFVAALEPEQVAAYAQAFDLLVQAAGGTERLACEVLSTVPYPLARVLERHGLGRFRVTGKADVTRRDDVYLLDNAAPADWVMPGTHDTATLWRAAREWSPTVAAARAAYAAHRLGGDEGRRAALQRWFDGSREALAQGELAVLFTGPARHVMLWVGDVLGETEPYNRPGVVHPDNWTWRVATDYRARHAERCARAAAFDPCTALALALEARGGPKDLSAALRAQAKVPLPG